MSNIYKHADKFTLAAQRLGFPARSVFKLKHLHEQFHIFKSGQNIVDLGAAPGSWTAFASQCVGPSGKVYAVDLQPLRLPSVQPKLRRREDAPSVVITCGDATKSNTNTTLSTNDAWSNVSFTQCDIYKWLPPTHLYHTVDAVISDLAPATTGDRTTDSALSIELCLHALKLSRLLLTQPRQSKSQPSSSAAAAAPSSSVLVLKAFQGPDFPALLKTIRTQFNKVQCTKPKGGRASSVEMFIVAKELMKQ